MHNQPGDFRSDVTVRRTTIGSNVAGQHRNVVGASVDHHHHLAHCLARGEVGDGLAGTVERKACRYVWSYLAGNVEVQQLIDVHLVPRWMVIDAATP